MREPMRFVPLLGLVCATLPAAAHAEKKSDELSKLSKIGVVSQSDDITVAIDGSRAPDFTSFTMNAPFRVVVDWAGSRLGDAAPEQSFDRGLVRRVTTQQFDSEAEKISRVVIELAQRTAYRVEAIGTRVVVHFVPVATPIPEPAPEPEPEPEPEPVKVAKEEVYIPEGPLTEPDMPVPDEAPVIVAKVEPKPEPKPVVSTPPIAAAPKEAPAAAPKPPRAAPPKEAIASAKEAAPPKPEPEPEPEVEVVAKKVEKSDPIAAVIAPDAPAIPEGAALTEPVMAEPEPAPKPEPKVEEPMRLAKFVPSEPAPVTPAPKKVEPAKVATPKVTAPPAAAPALPTPTRTQRLASKPDLPTKTWSPPALPAAKVKSLPVVVAQNDTLEPERTTPADPDVPVRDARPPPTLSSRSGGADPMDFDPGPRVMTYIGFRQMADVSRVFVRLDGKAQFRELNDGTRFAIELVDTSVNVKNNERPLDTTYFNSPVTKIKATSVGNNTRIDIDLRELVPHQVKRIGSTIAIDFTRR